MSGPIMSVQCKLERRNKLPGGEEVTEHLTSWIPKKFAARGKRVKLLDEPSGLWYDGWVVVSAGVELPTKVVQERGQDYKRTRKASDI